VRGRAQGRNTWGPLTTAQTLSLIRPLAPMASGGQAPVQVVGGPDQGQVREGLGEVAHVCATETEFLSVQAQVSSVPESLLKKATGFIQVTGPRQARHLPKRAHGTKVCRCASQTWVKRS